jgi:ABC-type siderophore export system fused ATPase/permease subunit
VKRFTFAWINIVVMVVLGGVIFINRNLHFYDAKSPLGYIIYGLFLITSLLAILGIVLTLINSMKAKNAPPAEDCQEPPSDDSQNAEKK